MGSKAATRQQGSDGTATPTKISVCKRLICTRPAKTRTVQIRTQAPKSQDSKFVFQDEAYMILFIPQLQKGWLDHRGGLYGSTD
ncbi:hypothetical protein OS493_040309 [Desmophyllum pertusum]|uniref:Uncharacterized protein n=1 Tax=Desmophyllum pertusum TaxID=174260 RepID=A0A9X0CIL8_9CNID|nr:hypothetical protein OS493_040309 [Desmophyllum pertusum]